MLIDADPHFVIGGTVSAHEPVDELLGERGQRLELGPRIGKVVAVRVDDRRAEGPIRAPRHDNEVGLERRPPVLVVLVGDPERGRRGAARVPIPRLEPIPGEFCLDDRARSSRTTGNFPFASANTWPRNCGRLSPLASFVAARSFWRNCTVTASGAVVRSWTRV